MGNILLGIQGPHRAQLWLLAVCAFLCLGQGADASKCQRCTFKGTTCKPLKGACISNSDLCYTLKSFIGDKKMKEMRGCWNHEDKRCGERWDIQEIQRRYEFDCCFGSDYCNRKHSSQNKCSPHSRKAFFQRNDQSCKEDSPSRQVLIQKLTTCVGER